MFEKFLLFLCSGYKVQIKLLILPILFIMTSLWVRLQSGPNWLWFNLDPDYFYLLDSLNILNLTTPGHVYHPGTTVQWLGAFILKLSNPLVSSELISEMVLVNPEKYLHLISVIFIFLNGFALWCVGIIGKKVFENFLAAGFLQLAPFVSMVVFKNSYHVKPESLLVFGTLMLIITALISLKSGLSGRRNGFLSLAFGGVAGFGIATKITALPIFLLPIFIFGQGRGISGWGRDAFIYCLSTLFAIVIFTLPAIQAYDIFFSWMATVSQGSGTYGGGNPEDAMSLGGYFANVFKLFKRPAFHVVFILAIVILVIAVWRRSKSRGSLCPEARLLAGILISQLAHVMLIATQPNAMYLIPSFILIPLAFVLTWRLGQKLFSKNLEKFVVVLFTALFIAQLIAVFRLSNEQAKKSQEAETVLMSDFKSCARVYSYSASSRSYALMLADFVTGGRMVEKLNAIGPKNDFWFEHWWDQSRIVFRDWNGPLNMEKVLSNYPCLVIRASHWYVLERLLPKIFPKINFDKICTVGEETLAVRGIDCYGRQKNP